MFERKQRTTNSVEAYNKVIGERLSTGGNFFHFLKGLLKEEYEKARHFALLCRTAGASGWKKPFRVIFFSYF